MPELFKITEEWSEQFWFSTGGTRAKKYLQAPDGKFYYFKRSQYKPATETKLGKDFTYEFWNEIIAYELGTMFGLNMLRYDIAIDGEIMGCISESMINQEHEELIEGVKYLQAFSPIYDPTKKEHQSWYSFDLIKNSLASAKLSNFTEDVIRLIIFDSLIGNGDRHQENWAVITEQRLMLEVIEEIEKEHAASKEIPKLVMWFLGLLKRSLTRSNNVLKKRHLPIPKSHYEFKYRFAPIYDSGSSFGRELTDERVNQLIHSDEELNRYIEKGVSEIHWEGKKLSHFDLISKINETAHNQSVQSIINQIKKQFNFQKLSETINKIDEKVPESYSHYKIPVNRKELIIKIITLRFKKLGQLIHEGI
jgi:hypothetical protein